MFLRTLTFHWITRSSIFAQNFPTKFRYSIMKIFLGYYWVIIFRTKFAHLTTLFNFIGYRVACVPLGTYTFYRIAGSSIFANDFTSQLGYMLITPYLAFESGRSIRT